MFHWVQVWTLVRPLQDLHSFSKATPVFSLQYIWVIVWLKCKPLPQPCILSTLGKVFSQDCSICFCIHLSHYTD